MKDPVPNVRLASLVWILFSEAGLMITVWWGLRLDGLQDCCIFLSIMHAV